MTPLQAARASRKLTLKSVAAAVGTDAGNLSKIERGIGRPSTELARKLFHYYAGEVPLGEIYDPLFDGHKRIGRRGNQTHAAS